MRATLAAALAGLVLAFPAAAQDVSHALHLGAPEGARATVHADRPFDSYALPVAPFGTDVQAVRRLEGRVIWSGFRLDDPQASVTGVVGGYRERLGEMGFRTLLDCATAACGGFDFRFDAQLLPPPAMLIDTADFAQLSAVRGGAGGADAYASILVSRVLGVIYVQTVAVLPGGAATAIVEAPEPAVTVQDEPLILPQDDALLLGQLEKFGHVPVRGLDFGTGGAALSEGSAEALEMLARLLKGNPEVSVVIVGHSDNEGTLEANIALSQRRAEAVRGALIERGVPGDRMEAHGAGFLAPVSTNATPEGRALNRRVELVLR